MEFYGGVSVDWSSKVMIYEYEKHLGYAGMENSTFENLFLDWFVLLVARTQLKQGLMDVKQWTSSVRKYEVYFFS